MISRLFSLAATTLAAITLIGCASSELSGTRDLLSSAGFFEVTPKGAKQEELYASAPAYKMHQITAEGKTFYMYKDEKRGTAFVGDTLKFRQYQRLLMQQSAAEEEAVLMPTPMAMGWYGAYGPYIHGPRYGTLRYYR
ncbi:hypothetical protein DES53_101493 [Roseimicrobium gellanilyticum]|uniref:Uncharacterized protein n=1 Tax=Roseimicrobium gellanilyticum TaxID=748857 RepID=A0A366HVU4_9BACT|nr:hypothetical protein [Roseimicrobium gellanilyticum]RBP47694.1 hypothetical protein DES53_101493 [Roseimicrobium gellanilyticum]